MARFWKYLSFTIILLYVVLGIYILVSPRFYYITKEIKVIFAIFLFLYAGWRAARIINREREKRDEE